MTMAKRISSPNRAKAKTKVHLQFKDGPRGGRRVLVRHGKNAGKHWRYVTEKELRKQKDKTIDRKNAGKGKIGKLESLIEKGESRVVDKAKKFGRKIGRGLKHLFHH